MGNLDEDNAARAQQSASLIHRLGVVVDVFQHVKENENVRKAVRQGRPTKVELEKRNGAQPIEIALRQGDDDIGADPSCGGEGLPQSLKKSPIVEPNFQGHWIGARPIFCELVEHMLARSQVDRVIVPA